MIKGGLKSKGQTLRQERRSLQILNNAINVDRIEIEHRGGDTVSIDGAITFLDEKGDRFRVEIDGILTQAMVSYQLKSCMDQTKQEVRMDIADIRDYVHRPERKAVLFFVNIPLERVYWEIIDAKYVESTLGIKDLENTKLITKTIKFRPEKVLIQDSDALYRDFANLLPDITNDSQLPQAQATQLATQEELDGYRNSLIGVFSEDVDKLLTLQALIFYFSPFLVSDQDILDVVLSKLELNRTDFDFYVQKLVTRGDMVRVGDVLSVRDTKMAQGLLSKLINEKGIEYIYG